ncbi:MAG: helix-turn-helix domain-containing protein [Thomasclavelia ramosa]
MIGDKIILYRKRKGLTQEELADLLEVSRQTVTKWESGSVLPNLDYIMGLSVIFGITIDNLVKDNDCAKQEIESKISNYNWIDFMLKAKKATYAKKEGKTVSSRPNSHDYQYQENEYLYIDTFVGSEFFGGEECVYKDNIPLYKEYYGKVLMRLLVVIFEEALLLVDRTSFRGPALYTNGNYTYHCSYDGDYEFLVVKRNIL